MAAQLLVEQSSVKAAPEEPQETEAGTQHTSSPA